MKTLIIRTDKLGDFYVTMPYINSLVKKFGKKNIDIIVSENIFEHFKKKVYFFQKIYSFPHKNFYKKLKLIFEIKKNCYENIIVFDGKDRSIILAILLNGIKKFLFMEERKLNFFSRIILSKKKYYVLIDNKIDTYNHLFTKLMEKLDVKVSRSDSRFLKYENLDYLDLPKDLYSNLKNYSLIHIDEKWFSKFYINNYIDIAPTKESFFVFIVDFLKKKKGNLIITTGLIYLPFVNDFKEKYLRKINENIFEYSYDDLKAILILKTSIKDLEILSMNSQNIITCNGPITQLAGSFNINVIDILEEKLENWYNRHISNKENYNKLFRKNFNELSTEILNKIK